MTPTPDYLAAGLALIPVPRGSKGPNHTGWNLSENAVRGVEQIGLLNGNIGLAHAWCNPTPTCALDIDDLDEAERFLASKGIDLQTLRSAPDAVGIDSGRQGSAKLLYRLPSGVNVLQTKRVLGPAGGVILEFRCGTSTGSTDQDILPPSLHPSGTIYEWVGAGSFARIPNLPDPLLKLWRSLLTPLGENADVRRQLISPNASVDPDDLTTLPDAAIADLRSALSSMRADSYSLWIRMGLALRRHGDIARGLWLDWSRTSDKYQPDEAARTWETLHPRQLDYTAVFAEATRHGWVNPRKRIAEPVVEALAPDWPSAMALPPALRPVLPCQPDLLPDSIREWAVDAADRFQCPIDYLVMPALVSAGSLVGNSVAIQPKRHDTSWLVHPTFWGAVVGPPGSMKTPTLNDALRPIRQLEDEASSTFKAAMAEYGSQMRIYEAELARYRKAIGKATVPLPPTEPTKPVLERFIVNDVTYQKLGEILAENPRGVMAIADELSGLLQSLDTPGQEAARGFFLAGWGGGGSYTFDRIQRGTIHLSCYCLSVFGGFQPDRIKGYVRLARSGSAGNDGLMQRFQLLVWPDHLERWTFVDRLPHKKATQRVLQAIHRMRHVAETGQSDSFDSRGRCVLRFDSSAQDGFDKWYAKFEPWLRTKLDEAPLASHFAKYRSLIPGLALLFHLLDSHAGNVCAECVRRAIEFAKYLRSHARRIYGSIHGGDYAGARILAAHLIRGDLASGFTARTVMHKGWSDLATSDAVAFALSTLTDLNWLQETSTQGNGRHTKTYAINPRIHSGLI